jgi:hypothetical protein
VRAVYTRLRHEDLSMNEILAFLGIPFQARWGKRMASQSTGPASFAR